jgi:hypothetical protein
MEKEAQMSRRHWVEIGGGVNSDVVDGKYLYSDLIRQYANVRYPYKLAILISVWQVARF